MVSEQIDWAKGMLIAARGTSLASSRTVTAPGWEETVTALAAELPMAVTAPAAVRAPGDQRGGGGAVEDLGVHDGSFGSVAGVPGSIRVPRPQRRFRSLADTTPGSA